jgi:hypothetical protein
MDIVRSCLHIERADRCELPGFDQKTILFDPSGMLGTAWILVWLTGLVRKRSLLLMQHSFPCLRSVFGIVRNHD